MVRINKDIEVTIDEHWAALNVTGDEQLVHRDANAAAEFLKTENEIIMQGVHLAGFLETLLPLKDMKKQYLLKRDIEFFKDSAVGININSGKVNLHYEFNIIQDNPFYVQSFKVRTDSKDIFFGKIYSTDNFGAFTDVMKRQNNFHEIFKYNSIAERPFLLEIPLDYTKINDFCRAIHMTREEYKDKYGEQFAGSFVSMKEPGILVSLLGDPKKSKYIFKKQNSEIYANTPSDKIQIFGEKTEKMKMRKVGTILKDGLGSILTGGETVAFAFS